MIPLVCLLLLDLGNIGVRILLLDTSLVRCPYFHVHVPVQRYTRVSTINSTYVHIWCIRADSEYLFNIVHRTHYRYIIILMLVTQVQGMEHYPPGLYLGFRLVVRPPARVPRRTPGQNLDIT